jgi:hypothetical protein
MRLMPTPAAARNFSSGLKRRCMPSLYRLTLPAVIMGPDPPAA